MKKRPAHTLHLTSLIAAGMALGAAPAYSAALGAIQVRSALGEKLDAVIQVVTAPGEELSSSCFRLGSAQSEDGNTVVRGARLTFEAVSDGVGRLRIQTADTVMEPVIKLPVQVKCPADDARDFQREYTLLLDPREYKSPVQTAADTTSVPKASTALPGTTRRKTPQAGSEWTVRSGDTVESIASSYYPKDGAGRRQFIDQMYALNPDLPLGYRVPLAENTQVALPKPRAAHVAASAADAKPAKTAKLNNASDRAVLRLDDSPPDMAQPSSAPSPGVAQVASQVAAEDQQLAQLKIQIAQLQQELADVRQQAQNQALAQAKARVRTAPAPLTPQVTAAPAAQTGGTGWGWLLFPLVLLLVLIPGVYAWRRWKKRQAQARVAEDQFPFQFATLERPTEHSVTTPLRAASPAPARGPVDAPKDLAHNIAQIANDWQNSTMDVVQPGNVSEEAQLLLDHGLLQQAINLLTQEIEQHPGIPALWMKLFSIYSQHHMKSEFKDRALEFKHSIQDEALWRQVQVMGCDIDPENPLYQASAEQAGRTPDYRKESALKQTVGGDLPDHEPEAKADPDMLFASAMREQAGLGSDEWSLAEHNEALPGNPLAGHTPFDPRSVEVEEIKNTPVFANDLEFDLDALPPLESKTASSPAAPAPAAIAAADFRSEDPAMQQIAAMLQQGQQSEATRALEKMLYAGDGDQRQLALHWLEKLQSTFDK